MVGLIMKKHHIPREIVEVILLNLPLKSLGRFSCVSKEWKSMIFNSDFIKKHRVRATRPGRERIIASPTSHSIKQAVMQNLSMAPRWRMYRHTSTVVAPAEWWGSPPQLHALCDGLLFVGVDNDLFLWNPAMKSFRKLPSVEFLDNSICGLGYDSVSDDYKLLLIPRKDRLAETNLYSLKSNSWRKIPSFHKSSARVKRQKCAFVNGALHWVDSPTVIVSFNLTTEEYMKLKPPSNFHGGVKRTEMSVFKGKVCMSQVYWRRTKFVLWSMEDDYTWTEIFKVDYHQNAGAFPFNGKFTVKPICEYDNGNILMHVSSVDSKSTSTCIYKPRDGTLRNVVWSVDMKMLNAYVYIESLVSPHSWPLLQSNHL